MCVIAARQSSFAILSLLICINAVYYLIPELITGCFVLSIV